jgi:hypothetical protein
MASYQQHLKQFGEKQAIFDPKTNVTHIGQLKITEDNGKINIEGDPLYQRYEQLTANMQALENQQRHYAPQFLLLQAKARGIKLEMINHQLDEMNTFLLKVMHKNMKDTLEINRALTLCGQDKLTNEDYQSLQIKGAKTEDEVNALKRHEIASQLKINQVTQDDIDFFDRQGAKALINYTALQHGITHANTLDEEDKQKGVAKTNARWRTCKVALLHKLFTELEINPETGKGFYEKTTAKKVREIIIKDEELSRYILFKLQLKTTSQLADIAFINKLFKKLLGLTTKRLMVREGEERYWIYSINHKSFAQLKSYHDNAIKQPQVDHLSPGMIILKITSRIKLC